MKRTFFAAIIIVLTSCVSRHNGEGLYHKSFKIGSVLDSVGFYNLNTSEIQLDSVWSSNSANNQFIENRSRISLLRMTNNLPKTIRASSIPGIPAPCYCSLENDTINVQTGIGFFAGHQIKIKISHLNFESSYSEYGINETLYAMDVRDSTFYAETSVDSKYQNLILHHRPDYKENQSLSGYLSFQTKEFYEMGPSGKIDTTYVNGEIFFTCKTTKKNYNQQ